MATLRAGDIEMGTAAGRGVVFATVLGSGISILDSLILNVALPSMDDDLELGVAGLQWTVSGYLLVVSSLLLLGGSIGDRYGRRRTYLCGLSLFIAASAACGLAPNTEVLVSARLIQGIGGALMIPTSLAILQATFVEADRGRAVGAWTGFGAFFVGIGPLAGGAFVTYASWRWAFLINLPLGVIAIWACLKWVPENKDDDAMGNRPDLAGAMLVVAGLCGVTYWAIEGPKTNTPWALWSGLLGLTALIVFVFVERRVAQPMIPLSMFKSKQFSWTNICTVVFYGAFVGGITFYAIRLQTSLGYSALEAGMAGLPANVLMLALAGKFGALAQRTGPRPAMTFGPLLVGISLVWMSRIDPGHHYWNYIFPAMCLWGFGMSVTVAPLTSSALQSVDQRRVGVASGINNAASRAGQTLSIALLPLTAGIDSSASLGGSEFAQGYERVMVTSGLLCIAAGMLAFMTIDREPSNDNMSARRQTHSRQAQNLERSIPNDST